MSGSGSSDQTHQPRGFWPEWLTPRRAFDFARNVMKLEQSVEALKADKADLETKLLALQRQIDEQAGQQKILLSFIGKALDEQVKARAEEAANEIYRRLASAVPPKTTNASRKRKGRDEK
jgi:hypothetical protein